MRLSRTRSYQKVREQLFRYGMEFLHHVFMTFCFRQRHEFIVFGNILAIVRKRDGLADEFSCYVGLRCHIDFCSATMMAAVELDHV